MMYYWLAGALCLAVLFLVIAMASVFCLAGLRIVRPLLRSLTPKVAASLLFTIRVLPVFLAGLVAFGFVLPAFFKFEPRSTSEVMGPKLLALALAGTVAVLAMVWRGLRLLPTTAPTPKEWQMRSQELRIEGCSVPVHRVDGEGALLAVTGLLRPRVFVGRNVTELLSQEELSAALAHELAHVRSFDNLRQFLLRMTRPPAWLDKLFGNDAAWVAASEVAADEEALQGGASALDLSSALVKIARLTRWADPNLAWGACQFVPEGLTSGVEMRVAHLAQWLEHTPRRKPPPHRQRSSLLLAIAMAAVTYAVCLNTALPWIHEGLELIVR